MAALLIVVITLILPFTPLDRVSGFSKLPATFIPVIIAIVIVYILAAEPRRKFYTASYGYLK